jgi:hypothetical protein
MLGSAVKAEALMMIPVSNSFEREKIWSWGSAGRHLASHVRKLQNDISIAAVGHKIARLFISNVDQSA